MRGGVLIEILCGLVEFFLQPCSSGALLRILLGLRMTHRVNKNSQFMNSMLFRVSHFAGVLLFLSVFGLESLKAVEAADTVWLSLDEAVARALTNNTGQRVASREVERWEWARKESRSALLPSFSATGAYNRVVKKQVMALTMGGETNRIAVGTANSYYGGFNFSLPLIAPTVWETVKKAELDIEAAAAAALVSENALVQQVKQAYFSILLARESKRVLQQAYDLALYNAKMVSEKYTNGLVSEYDKLRADVRVKNQKPPLVAAELSEALSAMKLRVLMGDNPESAILFTGSIADYAKEMVAVADEGELLEKTENSPELFALDVQKRLLLQSEKMVKVAYLPTLSASGNYQWTSLNEDFKIGSYRWTPYSTVGLSLNIPLFDGGQKAMRIKQLRLSAESVDDRAEELLRGLNLEVQSALMSMQNALEELESNRAGVEGAEKAYAISTKRYETGAGTLLELNDSEMTLTQSRLAYQQSIYSYMVAKSALEKATGEYVNLIEPLN